MGQRTRFLSIPVQFVLLIAVAIQGITPDANDLASTKALRLLCQLSADFRIPNDDADQACGEVCGSLRRTVRLILAEAAGAEHFDFISVFIKTPLDDLATGVSLANRARSLPDGDLPQVLCRMLC